MKTVPTIAAYSEASLPVASTTSASTNVLAWLRRAAGLLPRRRRGRLDPRTLSDHLKRDIGALDGNDPRGPRP